MAIIILMVVIVTTYTVLTKKNKKKKDKEIVISKKLPKKEQTSKENINQYIVDIKGEINNPGIYRLSSNSRVIDVIEKAGGLTENANTTVINLSKRINDEMVIIIYSNYEVENFAKTKDIEEKIIKQCNQKYDNSLRNDACIDNDKIETQNPSSEVSLNTASKEELTALPGIGESKADDIINYRNSNGGFKDIEELKNIKGIGDAIFDKIKDRLTL